MPRPQDSLPRHRRSAIAALVTLLMLLALPLVWLHARSGNDATGDTLRAVEQADYRVVTFDWFDARRDRAVPARLFWPDAAHQQRVPLVLFSHGMGSSDDGYTHLGRYWASHGIASLHVRHVGSDRALWDGNPLQLVHRFQRAAGDDEAIARAADLHLALDRLLDEPWGAAIDATRIVVAGHSYGANTAMLLAGARVVRDGVALDFGDARVRAAILISAPPFYGDADFAPILAGIRMPTLHVTTAHDVIHIPGFGSGIADRGKVFGAMGGDRTLAVFDRGSHNVFTDRRYVDTAAVADSVKAATRRVTLEFLQSLGESSDARFAALAALNGPGLVIHSLKSIPRVSTYAHRSQAQRATAARRVALADGQG